MKQYGVIYKTTNLLNGNEYVGQSTQTGRNLKYYLGSGIALQNAIKKYGGSNFEKEILCECSSKEQLDRLERLWISLIKPYYNLDIGGNAAGKHSEATRKKISDKKKGKKLTPEQYERYLATRKPVTEETKQKISETLTGRKQSKETVEKRCKKLRGRINSEESKNKMSKAHIGITQSEESKRKQSESKKGKPWTQARRDAQEKRKLSREGQH